MDKPNLVYVFGDQWRAQACAYAGDPNVRTPHIDRLAKESLRVTTAVANCPVCTPSRACLLSGQYPLTTGVFLNDVLLDPELPTLGKVLKSAGYDTAWIGKWHLDGPARSGWIPPQRQHGFDHWRALECTHDYNNSLYYADDDPTPRKWPGYDAIAQTHEACRYIRQRAGARPFALFLSWGPPHDPYHTAPQSYGAMYEPDALTLRPNVPPELEREARADLAGYYAHCTALDECLGQVMRALDEAGLADDTILVFTSDHGDMLGSQGEGKKQRPWDESILVPMLVRWPAGLGRRGREVDTPFAIVDTMPTLLSLCEIDVPAAVEGVDHAGHWRGEADAPTDAALIACYHPFADWHRGQGGREYRGVRTQRYTYVRSLDGPWLLYDNERDAYQRRNLVHDADAGPVRRRLDTKLDALLAAHGDEFLPAACYLERFGYGVNDRGAVPYTN